MTFNLNKIQEALNLIKNFNEANLNNCKIYKDGELQKIHHEFSYKKGLCGMLNEDFLNGMRVNDITLVVQDNGKLSNNNHDKLIVFCNSNKIDFHYIPNKNCYWFTDFNGEECFWYLKPNETLKITVDVFYNCDFFLI